MIELRTKVELGGISGSSVADFMLYCTDQDYQEWWPGTHLAFHTIKRFPGDLGNLVYFDEYLGGRRLRFKGVVVKHTPGREIVWQLKKGLRLPAWLVLELDDHDAGVTITHTIKVGLAGVGRFFDPLLRLFLNQEFEGDLVQHARTEFKELAKILS